MASARRRIGAGAGYRIVRGGHGDVAGVARLARDALPEAWPEEELRATLDSGGVLWVARGPAGELAGYLLAQQVVDEVHLLQIVVAAEHRGRGVGTALVHALVRAADGARAVYLEARASNRRALRFYERLGFVRVGLRPGYYAPAEGLPAEDAVLMRRTLSE